MNKLFNKTGISRLLSAFLSIILAFTVLVSTFTGLAAEPANAGEGTAQWDGLAASGFAVGSGTKADPYIVSTPAELLLAVTSTGMDGNTQLYYKMVNDIYVNDVSSPHWKSDAKNNQWAVASTSAEAKDSAFGGIFNGNGYKVFGLFVDKTYEAPDSGLDLSIATGLFPTIKDSAKISAVGVENSYFALRNNDPDATKAYAGYIGSITGYAYVSTAADPIVIDRCYASADVYTAGVYCGMVAGLSNTTYNGLKLSNSYGIATGEFHSGVSGNRFILVSGGLSAAAAKMEYTFSNGGLCFTGCQSTSKANYCNNWVSGNGYATKLPLADMKGEKALEKMANLNGENAYRTTESFPVLRVFDRTESGEKVWDGTFSEPTVGTGEETNPFIIKEPSELAYVIKKGGGNKFYRLESDIYLNHVNKVDWTTGTPEAGYTPTAWINSTASHDFKGTIDGNGHVVYGLYYNNVGTSQWEFTGTGLIPYVNNGSVAVLKNLGLDNCYINNPKNAGGLFGANAKGDITADQCYVGANVTLKGHLAGAFLGASNGIFTFTNCYSLASTSNHKTASDSYNGLIGDFYGQNGSATVANCYNGAGPLSTKSANPGTRLNIFAVGDTKHDYVVNRTIENMQGLDALTNEEKLLGLGDKFVATTTFPILKAFVTVEYSRHWDGTTVYAPIVGDGSVDAPYEIENAYMLAYVIKNGGGKNKYYKLTADIYLNDTDKIDWKTGELKNDTYVVNEWYTSKNAPVFKGNIDGDGHVIYGLYSKTDGNKEWKNFVASAGLIPNIGNGTVSITNLGIDCAYVKHPYTAGLFIGMSAAGEALISTSFAGENTHLSSYDAGVFVGSISGALDLKCCYSQTTFDADTHLQGFAGDIYRSPSSYHGERPTASIVGCYIANSPMCTKGGSGYGNSYDAYTSGKSGLIKLAPENMQGLDALSNKDKMVKLANYRAYQATEGYPVLRVFLENPEPLPEIEEEKIWNGAAAPYFAEGTGSEKDPYIISKGSELALMIESGGNGGAYFKLKNDIYLNDVSETLWYNNENNKQWYTDIHFNGHLDGDGHCVYGIWYPKNNTNTTSGLIPVFAKGSIKNLGVRYSYIFAEKYAGGLAGKTHMGTQKTISTCFVDDTVQVGYTTYGNYGAGGFIGYVDSDMTTSQVRLFVENCYSKALVSGLTADRYNGLFGTVWKSAIKVSNCYSVNAAPYYMGSHGTISSLYWDYSSGVNYTEGAAGLVDINEITSGVYSDRGSTKYGNNYTILSEESLRGEKAATVLTKFDFENVWKVSEKGTPTLKIFGLKGDDIDVSEDGITYASGSGKKYDPYIIETVEQFRYLLNSPDTEGKYYKLVNDLYINDTSKKNWMQNSPTVWYSYGAYQGDVFKGHFDGDGHYIYGVYIADTPEKGEAIVNGAAGLFPNAAAGAEIRNIHVRDSYISGKAYAGAIVGFTTGPVEGKFVTIIGCSADESVTVKGQTAGGLVGGGGTQTQLQYVYFTGTVESTSEGRANAFVGDIWKNGQLLCNGYSTDYTNYRNGFYPQISKSVYATVSQPKATIVSKSEMYGNSAKKAMPALDWNIWYTVNRKTPHMKVITDDMIVSFSAEGKKGEVWTGFVATKFAGGTGTEEDPFLIETAEQLALLVNATDNTKGKYFKLVADIIINDTTKKDWTNNANEWFNRANVFKGYFDGDGHVVSGLYCNAKNAIVGLFPRVGEGAVVEKVGVIDSILINRAEGGEAYTAALIGHVSGNGSEDDPETFVYPILRQCFADDTVYIESAFTGGLVCGNQRGINIYDCYFSGELTGSSHTGTIVGNTWNTFTSHVTTTYAVDLDRNAPVANGTNNFVYEGVYVDGETIRLAVAPNAISIRAIKGESAKTTMPEFDFVNVWKTVENGTPVLRCFKNAEKYTSRRDPKKIELSFATDGGDPVEAISGFMGDKIPELPVPTRYGYVFKGWYVNHYKVIEFTTETFPANNMVLYAAWEKTGLENGFESALNDPVYDWNDAVEIFQPGVPGYNPKYVYAGMRTMHVTGESENDALFLVNYVYPLEIGKVYDVRFRVRLESGDGQIDFLHAQHPQFDSPVVGYQKICKMGELAEGEWVEVKTMLTANAPYIVVRASAGCELYFDEFQMVPTGETGEVGELEGFAPTDVNTEPQQKEEEEQTPDNTLLWIIIGVAGGVIVLGTAAILTILLVKKNNKRKAEKTE